MTVDKNVYSCAFLCVHLFAPNIQVCELNRRAQELAEVIQEWLEENCPDADTINNP